MTTLALGGRLALLALALGCEESRHAVSTGTCTVFTVDIPESVLYDWAPLAWSGSAYGLVFAKGTEWPDLHLFFARIEDGIIVENPVELTNEEGLDLFEGPSMVWTGSLFALGWSGARGGHLQFLDETGSQVLPELVVEGQSPGFVVSKDGATFVLWGGDNRRSLQRIDADGRLEAPIPIVGDFRGARLWSAEANANGLSILGIGRDEATGFEIPYVFRIAQDGTIVSALEVTSGAGVANVAMTVSANEDLVAYALENEVALSLVRVTPGGSASAPVFLDDLMGAIPGARFPLDSLRLGLTESRLALFSHLTRTEEGDVMELRFFDEESTSLIHNDLVVPASDWIKWAYPTFVTASDRVGVTWGYWTEREGPRQVVAQRCP